MILCCAIFSYPSDSDIEGEFLIEIFTPVRPRYDKNLLDRLSQLTEGILMVNSSLGPVHTKTIVNANASKRKLFYAFRPSVHTKTMKTLTVNALIRKRSPKWINLKTPFMRLRVVGRKRIFS